MYKLLHLHISSMRHSVQPHQRLVLLQPFRRLTHGKSWKWKWKCQGLDVASISTEVCLLNLRLHGQAALRVFLSEDHQFRHLIKLTCLVLQTHTSSRQHSLSPIGGRLMSNQAQSFVPPYKPKISEAQLTSNSGMTLKCPCSY